MECKIYKKKDQIFKANDEIDRLIIIQSGIVELSITYDKRAPIEFDDTEDSDDEAKEGKPR